MAEPSSVSLLSSLKAGQAVLIGKLANIVKLDKSGFKFDLVQPASDPYSFPHTFEVRSEARPGADGELVTVRCELRSFSRKVPGKDGESMIYRNTVLYQL